MPLSGWDLMAVHYGVVGCSALVAVCGMGFVVSTSVAGQSPQTSAMVGMATAVVCCLSSASWAAARSADDKAAVAAAV